MASTSSSNKKARVEKRDYKKDRMGVTARLNADGVSVSWLVETRLPNLKLKLHFGTYKSKEEAMIARDYVAFLRNSTGKEKPGAVGGYRQRDDPMAIFEFEESLGIFDRLKFSKECCDEFKRLFELNSKDARDAFVKNAKADILRAIKSFRSTYPEKFGYGSDDRGLQTADPVDGEAQATTSSLTCGIRVLPTAGCNVGDGSAVSRVKVVITLECFAREAQNLSNEELCSVVRDNFDHDKIRQAVTNKSHQKQLPEKMLAEMAPCTVDPNDYPPLE